LSDCSKHTLRGIFYEGRRIRPIHPGPLLIFFATKSYFNDTGDLKWYPATSVRQFIWQLPALRGVLLNDFREPTLL
jgi:hypothetical protein